MAASKKHVLVLGGTGFIGSAFFEALLKEEGCHIHLLVRNAAKQPQSFDRVTIYLGDLTTFNWNKLTDFPDIVFHFARVNSSVGRSIGRKLAALKGKRANKRLLRFLKSTCRDVSLVYLSGSLMYGNHSDHVTEEASLNPISFARDYLLAEKPFLKQQIVQGRVRVSFVRVPWVLGKGSWFSAFYEQYIREEAKVPLYGNGENVMSFITLRDLATCLIEIMKSPYKKVLNVAYPQSCTQQEFVQLVSEVVAQPIQQLELRNQYERAVVEAFESNIQLATIHPSLNALSSGEALPVLLKNELSLMLKDIK